LRRAVSDFKLSFVAEEYYEELLVQRGEESIAKEIALEIGIEHRFCNPNNEELCEIGCLDLNTIYWMLRRPNNGCLSLSEIKVQAQAILTARYSPIRERFWFDRLGELRGRDGVFVCGDAHVESFARFLGANQIATNVVARGIGFVPGEGEETRETMKYLSEHPELANWEA
jgi:hypothetical protein